MGFCAGLGDLRSRESRVMRCYESIYQSLSSPVIWGQFSVTCQAVGLSEDLLMRIWMFESEYARPLSP